MLKINFMKRRFLSHFGERQNLIRAGAIFLIILGLAVQPVIFGQSKVLARNRFARFPLSKRAQVFEPAFAQVAFEEHVDPRLLWTICYLETRFRPWLRSPAGAEGLMQFIPSTALRFNLFDPYQAEPAIRAAARYVRFLADRFGERIDSILAGYNAGEGAVDAYLTGRAFRSGKKNINERGLKTVGGVPPYRETIAYVARGLIVYRLLQKSGKFSDTVVSYLFPRSVSEQVARVWLKDNEIGFNGSLFTQMENPQFWSSPSFPETRIPLADPVSITSGENVLTSRKPIRKTTGEKITKSAITAGTVSNDSKILNPDNEKTEADPGEIYYEPRTGARYRTTGGKKERLPENGDLVIGEFTSRSPQPISIRARGTYFGGKSLPPK